MRSSSPRGNEDVVSEESFRSSDTVTRCKAILAEMEQLHSEISEKCYRIVELSVELDNMKDSEDEECTALDTSGLKNYHRRCFGAETNYLVEMSCQLCRSKKDAERALLIAKQCIAMRCNEVRSLDFIRMSPVPSYGTLFVNCLQYNTNVMYIRMDMYKWTMKGAIGDIGYDYDDILCYEAMLRLIETSVSLRKFTILGREDCSTNEDIVFARRYLHAIGKNRNIEEVKWEWYLPPEAFHAVISTSSSIKKLSVQCKRYDWEDYSVEEILLIQSAFRNNKSIVSLSLSTRCLVGMESILQCLTHGNCALRELSLQPNGDVIWPSRLSQLLPSISTLQHLELTDFYFHIHMMDCLLEGLQYHYVSPTSTLTKLSLLTCGYSDDAAQRFSHFLQKTRYEGECSGNTELKELRVEFNEWDTEFAGVDLGSAMVALVSRAPMKAALSRRLLPDATTHTHHITIGSQLRALKLRPFKSMGGFCKTTLSKANEILLQSLHLSELGHKELSELATCIPQLLTLQELHLDAVVDTVSPKLFLLMVQKSGSLRSVTFAYNHDQHVLSEHHIQIAEAFCKRNQILQQLLLKPDHWNIDHDCEHPNHIDERTVIFPTLLHVAKQIPPTKVSTIMAALITRPILID